jgi:hypothetical protein
MREKVVAIGTTADAGKLGRVFAQAAQDEPLVKELWTTTRRDGVHLWLLIDQVGDEEERRLFGLLDVLDERFPDADVQLHILNPASYTIDLHDVLPRDATKIFVRIA